MSVLVITGSAREGSFTRALGGLIAAEAGGQVAAPLNQLPFFDQDLEVEAPASVRQLREQVRDAELVVIVTPEYNGTISGLLGNAIDWLSRPYGAGALQGKSVLAVSASPGEIGGVRALVALRTVLGNAGAALPEETLSVGSVHARLTDPALREEVAALLAKIRAKTSTLAA